MCGSSACILNELSSALLTIPYAHPGRTPPTPPHPTAQILRRDTLWQLVSELPGHKEFPWVLVKTLLGRIKTWLLPIYGFSKEEELGRVPEANVEGERHAAACSAPRCSMHRVVNAPVSPHCSVAAVVQQGVADAALLWEGNMVKVAGASPSREYVLLAMQAHGIELKHYDLVQLDSKLFPVETFYHAVYSAGGPVQAREVLSRSACPPLQRSCHTDCHAGGQQSCQRGQGCDAAGLAGQ